ncbi:MAG: hypothetical protein PHT26_13055 [Lentimicrobiaceae bacterium]|nr:hypothetical protein [Lentimicrobiaceae bacterium]
MNLHFVKILGIVLLLASFLIILLLMRELFIKGINHFKFIKALYPKELVNVNSYFQMMWPLNSFILDFWTMVWFWMPFYYSKQPRDNLTVEMLGYHKKLIKTNKKIMILICLFICDLILVALVASHMEATGKY